MIKHNIEIKDLLNKKIICIGTGKFFSNFKKTLGDLHLENQMQYAVDNDTSKHGTFIDINGKSIEIISITHLAQVIDNNAFIIFTTKYMDEIIKQMETFSEFNDAHYCCYTYINIIQHDYLRELIPVPSKLWNKDKIIIPKVIHYCWFGKSEIPDDYKKWMETWKKYCPDYEIVEWNESNYDIHQNQFIEEAYNAKKWAFVSDFARLDVIEKYGGVYLDSDVELTKCLDDLLKNEAFCGFESKEWVNFGLGYGSIPHHPIIKRLRDDYLNRRFILEDGSYNVTPCPRYQTNLLVEYGLKRDGTYQELTNITVVPEIVLCGMSPVSYRITTSEYNYAIHHFAASWNKEYQEHKIKIKQLLGNL